MTEFIGKEKSNFILFFSFIGMQNLQEIVQIATTFVASGKKYTDFIGNNLIVLKTNKKLKHHFFFTFLDPFSSLPISLFFLCQLVLPLCLSSLPSFFALYRVPHPHPFLPPPLIPLPLKPPQGHDLSLSSPSQMCHV